MATHPVEAEETPIPDESLFLGTLRSDFDSPDKLPVNFERLKATYKGLMELYNTDQLSPSDLASHLSKLKAFDQSGSAWTIGGSSAKWYKRLVDRWVPSGPPLGLAGDALPGQWEEVESFVASRGGVTLTPTPSVIDQPDQFPAQSFSTDPTPVAQPAEVGTAPTLTSPNPASRDEASGEDEDQSPLPVMDDLYFMADDSQESTEPAPPPSLPAMHSALLLPPLVVPPPPSTPSTADDLTITTPDVRPDDITTPTAEPEGSDAADVFDYFIPAPTTDGPDVTEHDTDSTPSAPIAVTPHGAVDVDDSDEDPLSFVKPPR
jgi:hypothetical protein